MRIPRFLESFAALVRAYGTPRYGEIDPTLLFTLTYVIMFGMMFGDVGHGITIALAAWLARRKLKRFTVFAVFAGFSATTFGFMYGSIFGYEHILHPVWIAPLSDPIYMLLVALGCGVAFLLTAGLISIHNRLANRDLLAAFFDNNGVISLLLYFSLLAGTYQIFETGSFGWPAALAGGLALALLAGYKWTRTKAPLGERLLIALLETFETLTSYASNTLSFLRISAFSLNHVALAIAVFTLADMMSTAGHVLMVIFGNLFILVLEGAIVTIQALRLEYYEGFSRFFSGDGRQFQPLLLENGPADHAGPEHPSSRS